MSITYSDYDPAQFYLKYNNQPTSTYYTYYIFNTFFDKMGYPLPNMFDFTHAITLQYWSSIFESPLLKAGLLFSISNTTICSILLVYFIFTWLKNSGFEGFEYNNDPKNIDTIIAPMSWWLFTHQHNFALLV